LFQPFASHVGRQELSVESRPHPDAFTHLGLGGDAEGHLADRALPDALDGLVRGRELASE